MTAWERVRARIEAADAGKTAELVLELTDGERREVAKELPAYMKERREAAQWRILEHRFVVPLLIAGAGCLGGAAAVTSWLFRPPLRVWGTRDEVDHVPLLARVVAGRPDEWRLDLAGRVAARLRPSNLPWQEGSLWRFAALLVTEAGAEPPAGDAFVAGWLQCGTGVAGLRTDPFLDALVPRLFEADGVGRILTAESASWRQRDLTWESELRALASDGRVKRETLLDGCVSRFLRGGTANDLKWFVTLHDGLAPTLPEVRARSRDYLRLLPAAPGSVADLALREIRRADEASPLDEAAFTEAAEALLFRPEKKLVRAALGWLSRTAGGRVDATLRALTVLFGQEALDLRERAVKLVVKHAPKARTETLASVRDAAATLPGDLREQIAAACGAVEPLEPVAEHTGVAPYTPRALPPAIGSVAELAEEVAALLGAGELGWQQGERLLAGLVEFAYRDAEGTRTALERVIGASQHAAWLVRDEMAAAAHPRFWIGTVAGVAIRPPAPQPGGLRAMLSRAYEAFRMPNTDTSDARVAPPQRVLYRRMREAAGLVGTMPLLLSTPTEANGQLDPRVLVSRLETLETAGLNAPPRDLEQALLRLPRTVDVDAAVRARGLTSPSGRLAADTLASGGLPDPSVTTEVLMLPRLSHTGYPSYERKDVLIPRLAATVSANGRHGVVADANGAASGPHGAVNGPHGSAAGHHGAAYGLHGAANGPHGATAALHETAADLCRLPRPSRADYPRFHGTSAWWPALMPSHREVIAAHLLPQMADLTEDSYGHSTALLGLAEADGPAGDAVGTALAYGLSALKQNDRSAGVDAFLTLAGRDQAPSTEIGRAIGRLAHHKLAKLNRVTAALTDATDAGAHREVWTAIITALPDVLPQPGESARTGLPDLLALATRCAEATGARAEIPELTAAANRGGSSRLAKEAARLQNAASPS